MKLEANNLVKSFGEKQVLNGISLAVESGKALGLLGRNGAGKTTSIRIIMDVFPPNSGEVLLDGKPIKRDKIKIGYMPEERGLYPQKVIIDQLTYLGELRGMKARDAKDSAKKLLDRLEMQEYTNKKLETLSKGNQQKIQLVATLMCDPDIVILDEPFSGLDPVNAMLLKDLVRDMIRNGKVVLFSSHQMNYVEEFCNDIAILNKGNIVCNGNIKEIKRSYARDKIIISGADITKMKAFIDTKLNDITTATKIVNESLTIQLIKAEQKNYFISTLAQQGFDIDELRVYEPSLNDIFVEHTEDAI